MLVTWKWYQIIKFADNPEGTEWWKVTNIKTGITVHCSSENAALRIVELAYALRMGEPKPHNHSTLQKKAKELEGISVALSRFYNWDGNLIPYTDEKERRYQRFLDNGGRHNMEMALQ